MNSPDPGGPQLASQPAPAPGVGGRLLGFFKTGPDRPVVGTPEEIRRRYELNRWSVFATVTFGYGFYYVCRVNFSVVKKPMLDEGILSAPQMGYIGSAMLLLYAVGRFTNGFLADRANIRRFMSTALLLCAAANFLVGFTTAFWVFFGLWLVNGWFQTVGSAPSVVALSQWFTPKERGVLYGIWSMSHGIGELVTFLGTAYLVSRIGWRWGFWGPGLACAGVAVIMFLALRDRPQTYGLPSVGEYKGLAQAPQVASSSTGALQLEVLKRPAVWILGLSCACMYVARYGMDNWGVLYLQTVKHYPLVEAGRIFAFSPIAQMIGTVSSGFVSAWLFKSRRNPPALIYGIIEIGSLVALFLTPPGHPWIDRIALVTFGVALGSLLVYLGGLMAVDIVPQRTAGAAMGIIGLMAYVGAALQDVLTGYLIGADKHMVNGADVYSFDRVAWFWVAASVASVVLAASIWKVRPPEEEPAAPA